MKSILSLLLSLAFAVALFLAGAGIAFSLLVEPEPHHFAHVDEKPLWTSEPVAVDIAAQSFERLPAAPVPAVFRNTASAIAHRHGPDAISLTSVTPGGQDMSGFDTTGSDPAGHDTAGLDMPQPADMAATMAHRQWCQQRYRSYDPVDDSYQPYDGPRRPCISPFPADAGQGVGQDTGQEAAYQDISRSGMPLEDFTDDPAAPIAEPAALAVHDQGIRTINADNAAAHVDNAAAHVDWCLNRYNSYRPSDNSYQPYHGPRRSCRSPFG